MAKQASEHTERVAVQYEKEIKACIEHSEIIRETKHAGGTGNPETEVLETDTVSAVFRYEGNITVINFASYKNPGGKNLTAFREVFG